ncbi:hypothetical protein DFH28DRAFT_885595 [Melampsora americana]|nr:hypothetical protein DFH28DRAFT_885595 [Melampsora americana]
MQSFERMMHRTLSSENPAVQPDPLPNLMDAGYEKLQQILKTEYIHNSQSRFRWGSTQVVPSQANVESTDVQEVETGQHFLKPK